MALLLHLETATTMCSVALSQEGKLLDIIELNAGFTHAENLVAFCDQLIKKCGFTFQQLDAVVVSKGPGSYTGLRIGVAAAKGFCYALNIPLISINTLQQLAKQVLLQHTTEATLLCPMIDARRMEVYCAFYDLKAKEIQETKAEIINENSFRELLDKHKIVFFGDGAAKCKSILSGDHNALFLDDVIPSARYMISLAEEKYAQQKFEDVAYFEPFYLKEFMLGGN